jgi:hypothetical protein
LYDVLKQEAGDMLQVSKIQGYPVMGVAIPEVGLRGGGCFLTVVDQRLWVTTSADLLRQVIDRKEGRQRHPFEDQLSSHLPNQVTQAWMVHPRVDEHIQTALKAVPFLLTLEGYDNVQLPSDWLETIPEFATVMTVEQRGNFEITTLVHSEPILSPEVLGVGPFLTVVGFSSSLAAIPATLQARDQARRNACINNQRQLRGASDEWAIEENASSEEVPSRADLDRYLRRWPVCPSGGSYTVGSVGNKPSCSVHGRMY